MAAEEEEEAAAAAAAAEAAQQAAAAARPPAVAGVDFPDAMILDEDLPAVKTFHLILLRLQLKPLKPLSPIDFPFSFLQVQTAVRVARRDLKGLAKIIVSFQDLSSVSPGWAGLERTGGTCQGLPSR